MKTATAWIPTQPGNVATDAGPYYILLEDGVSQLLAENLDNLILETTTVTPKESTAWAGVAKPDTSWIARDATSAVTTATTQLLTDQAGNQLITQDGNNYIFNETTVTTKEVTQWTNL
jgi:hypothetical protein